MNRTDSPSRAIHPPVQWNDPPAASPSNHDLMEREANLLLPQMAAALDYPCTAESAIAW